MRYINIAFSTTRQFNPWDEFIRRWIENLLNDYFSKKDMKTNYILFDRSPHIRCWKPICIKNNYLKYYENSLNEANNINNVDIFIFAWTPEWSWFRHWWLYKKYLPKVKNIMYLWIWNWKKVKLPFFDSLYTKYIRENFFNVYRKAKLITTRDENTFNYMKEFNNNVLYTWCPAIFSSKNEKIIDKITTIWITIPSKNCWIWNKVKEWKIETYLKILHRFITDWVWKWIKKIVFFAFVACEIDSIQSFIEKYKSELQKYNIDIEFFYSYNFEDYIKKFWEIDFLVTTRVHWWWLASSWWIPNIVFGHDERAKTVLKFKSYLLWLDYNYDDLYSDWEDIYNSFINRFNKVCSNPIKYNSELIGNKRDIYKEYMILLNKTELFL